MWGSAKGLYLDKGFNVKFSYKPKSNLLPHIAVGLDDFAGTGQFTKEYISTTYNFNKIKITTGIGWGKFVGERNVITNPLNQISDRFKDRPSQSSNYGRGGKPAYDKWFRGDAIYFGGIEMPFGKKNNYSFKIESNPFDYFRFGCCGEGLTNESYVLRKSKSNFNYGFSFKLREFGNIDLSYIKGDTLNLSLSIGINTKKPLRKKNKFKPTITNIEHNLDKKNEFYLDLLENLNNNRLYLQTASLQDNNVKVTIDTPDIVDPIQYSSRTAFVVKEILKVNELIGEIDKIDVGLITRGMQLNKISYRTSDIENKKTPITLVKKNTKFKDVDLDEYMNDEFKPVLNFPVIYYGFEPNVKTHVGSPERFLYYGFGLKFNTDIQFSRNISFNSSFGSIFSDNFDDKVSTPNSRLEKVRTEIVDYLQSSDSFYIENLQFDYIGPVTKNVIGRLSVGLLEQMYGGISSEILYKPFYSNFAFSFESNFVRKRDYEGRFSFLNYKTNTYHFNTSYYHPKSNILTRWSYGTYLAGDRGYTLDLSRRSPSGWQAGFYFSRTNVSAQDFGEGSFDKGFYFRIPFNLLQKDYNKDSVNFSLKTMTRDGGQKLVIKNKLIDSFYGSSFDEINENWSSYLK